jgi:oligogalacturonide lyase
VGKGEVSNDARFAYADPYSGRQVVQLTNHLGHSNHLYFTDPCWLDGGSFIFTSDRENRSNLFRYDLDTGAITQLTDLERVGRARPGGCYSVANRCHYFWWDRALVEMSVDTLEERTICRAPPGLTPRGRANPTADGRYVCSGLMEVPEEEERAIAFSYSRFREFFYARPLSQIVRVEVATGELEVIHEDRCYLGHVNTSPTLPDVLTFCHEGPWDEVDQRIWGLNVLSGETWRIRPQEGDVAIGHEYWFTDGERIGYHGRHLSGAGDHVFGRVRWDDSGRVEAGFPFHSTHFHSLDESLIVGDGTPANVFTELDRARPFIQLFRWDGERYVGPRVLAYHRSTFNDQHAHCHPRFAPDGGAVLYTSDLTRYSNVYLVEVGDFDDLPELEVA